MPDKTTQKMTLEQKLAVFLWGKDLSGDAMKAAHAIMPFLTEALSQQQQEDDQDVLDLDIMKDEYLLSDIEKHEPIDAKRRTRNQFRKELRQAIAEKRGKV